MDVLCFTMYMFKNNSAKGLANQTNMAATSRVKEYQQMFFCQYKQYFKHHKNVSSLICQNYQTRYTKQKMKQQNMTTNKKIN